MKVIQQINETDFVIRMEKEYDKEIFEAKNLSFFEHCILCKSLTILKELQLKFKKYFRDKTVRK